MKIDSGELKQSTPDKGIEQTQSQILIGLASSCELFHNPDHEVFATITTDSRRETLRIRSKGFRRWLLHRFYKKENKASSAQAMTDTLGVLEARAEFEGPEYPIYVRIAGLDRKIYLNLSNDKCEVVEIDPDGWRIITESPVKFINPRGALPLPRPVRGGSICELRSFLNLDSENDWILFVATLMAAFKPSGPYPVTSFQGEQGSAKSTAMRVKRALIDPATAPLRTTPRDSRDLMIHAKNSWVLSFDNVSRIKEWLADDFCRLATGGGFATRELYTDNEENIIDAQRPVDLNGIEEIVTRDDLLDRTVIIKCPTIFETGRKDEQTFWREFKEAQPRILGSILYAVSAALKKFPSVKMERKPRMADFAKWVTAAEPGLGWEPGAFMQAYTANRAAAVEMGLESSPVAQAVQELIKVTPEWRSTATDLLDELEKYVSEKITKSKSWPKSPSALSGQLRRLAPNLRAVGIEIDFDERESHSGKRFLRIRKAEKNAVTAVSAVTQGKELFIGKGLAGDESDGGDDDLPLVSAPDPSPDESWEVTL